MLAVGVLDDQLAPFVLLRLGEEQRGGHIGAHRVAQGIALDGAVHVIAIVATARVAIEHRPQHLPGQRRRDEQRMPRQGIRHLPGQAGIGGRVRRKLQVALEARRLGTGTMRAVDPRMGGQLATDQGDFLLGQNLGDMQQHRHPLH
ncbi:hypothetical protein D3C85_1399060 [compost metagenome]